MNKPNNKEIIKSYLKKNSKYIILIISLFFINLLIIYLYNIDIKYIIESSKYILLLSVFIIISFFAIDYYRYKEKIITISMGKSGLIKEIKDKDLSDNIYLEWINSEDIKNKKLKNEYDKSIDDTLDYFTMWVHQIKNPIAAAKLMINNKNLNPYNLSVEIFKIEEYVSMVLAYLKLDTDKYDLVVDKHRLDDLIKIANKKYASLYIQSRVSLDYKGVDDYIITDKKWFTLVIEQIISNSIKYTNEGGTISIYTDNNILYIKDNGIGIMERDLPLIFNKGFTGISGRIYEESSGIGLYLVKKTLDLLGFPIEIESKVDEGTLVKINFNEKSRVLE